MNAQSEAGAQEEIEHLRLRLVELERALSDAGRREQELRDAESRYRMALDGGDNGFWEWNTTLKSAQMSAGWFNILGYQLGEVPNNAETWSKMIHPADLPVVSARFVDHLAGVAPAFEVEHRMFHKSGKSVWIRSRGKVLERDAEGRPVRVIGSATDVTKQKETEEALRRSQSMDERVIAAQRDAIRELSTPLLPIGHDAVVMPLIGRLDSQRAQQLMTTLLQGVVEHRAATVILDVTGVQLVDAQVAEALVQASRAVRLLGAAAVLTGVRPEVARALVDVGADLGDIVVHGSLRSGIAYALARGSRAQ